MIRADELRVSKAPYAFVPATFKVSFTVAADKVTSDLSADADGRFRGVASVGACWFRRRRGVLVASLGIYSFHLNRYSAGAPDLTFEAWATAHTDNRYGGSCHARWDGSDFWTAAGDPDVAARHLGFLRAMHAAGTTVPDGYDGWWEAA